MVDSLNMRILSSYTYSSQELKCSVTVITKSGVLARKLVINYLENEFGVRVKNQDLRFVKASPYRGDRQYGDLVCISRRKA